MGVEGHQEVRGEGGSGLKDGRARMLECVL